MINCFRSKRGRPRMDLPKVDYGTKELRIKRMFELTNDAISLCLSRGLITEEDYQTAMWLRFLHNVNFGNLNVTAYNIASVKGTSLHKQDPKWLAKQEKKYKFIIQELNKISAKKIVTDICVFDLKPEFLFPTHPEKTSRKNFSQLSKLREGLELIRKIYSSYFFK